MNQVSLACFLTTIARSTSGAGEALARCAGPIVRRHAALQTDKVRLFGLIVTEPRLLALPPQVVLDRVQVGGATEPGLGSIGRSWSRFADRAALPDAPGIMDADAVKAEGRQGVYSPSAALRQARRR